MADLDIKVITNIEGLAELEEALVSGSPRAAKKFLRRTEKQAAKIFKKSAEENAPYAEGNLAADIQVSSSATNDAMTVKVGPGRDGFYGVFLEFGAPEANVPAEHWLENSAKEVQDEVLQELIAAFEDGLSEMKQKGGV